MKIRSLIKTKKSGFEDTFMIIAILFTVIVSLLIINKAWSSVKTPLDEGLSGAMPDNSPVNITTTLDSVSSTTTLFDKLMPLLIIGLFGFVMMGAAIYSESPIFIFVGIVVLAVAILLGVVYSNVYHQIAETDSFASTTADYPISNLYMKFLPYLIFLMAIGVGIMIMYSKKQVAGGGGL